MTKKNILGRRNTQYYVLDPENFKINYGHSKKKVSKTINLRDGFEDQEEFITPHPKNEKKFIINMGTGKNAY